MGAQAQNIRSKNPHSQMHKQLLASQTKSSDQIKLIEQNTFIDLIEDLEPEIDIYTEGWNSKRVNPFQEKDVPNQQVIDVTGYHMPVKNIRITSNYGYRAKFGRMHKGIDMGIKMRDTIYAAFDGKVRLTNYEAKGYGNYVILRHPNGLETIYGHLTKALVKPEQTVRAGQPIALGGNTGRTRAPPTSNLPTAPPIPTRIPSARRHIPSRVTTLPAAMRWPRQTATAIMPHPSPRAHIP